MSTINASAVQLLQEMQQLSYAAQGIESSGLSASSAAGVAGAGATLNFAETLKATLDQVNEVQKSAQSLHAQYEMGTPGVDLSDVMIAMQKASLSLQMVQNVRGRLVSAYQDLMNMPI